MKATPLSERAPRSPTTSSPVLLETPPSPLRSSRSSRLLRERHHSRRERRADAHPYYQRSVLRREAVSPSVNPRGLIRTSPTSALRARSAATRSEGHFLPAGWPYRVAHLLRSMTQPGWSTRRCPTSAGVTVPHRAVWDLQKLAYATPVGCPYDVKCVNSLEESSKVYLARNARTRQLSVIAAEDIETGEVLGQYFGELEHVSVDQAHRPRNEGYRLVMTQLPERPSHPVRVAINAVQFGGLIRLVNHSCAPKGKSSRSTMEVISDLCVDAI
ncbi:hypothetical protein PC129_g20877 [Phytophthora cactorum]|uniref:SET domain-containing protein n=1 Tax=Phytophthora cactorum TaxID=29920 RepID=A0A329RRY1_9STRA|nr:hypothetical protein Pcac1_g21159 [Phytophthora cactorum]KAG2801767.1 hypothetical protein PC111_g19401 [Phytophthora cactorum]KAG2817695.1 hypothetical protein PC112_g12949 [Phytophthora cactorum]KAG2850066.1 hypothetical protein PC113_g17110 [Phytophthora cactorum]KAG2880771.1 hypothetical protein PC114_g21902 [Phytophthora cactorum]